MQLFASDCAICHKSPAGLAKAGGIFGVERFLREHYTSNRQSAAAIARYLESVGEPPAARPARRKGEQRAKGTDGKPGKPEEKKSDGIKPADSSAGVKPAETKPAESKPAETAAPEAKPAASPPAESGSEKKD